MRDLLNQWRKEARRFLDALDHCDPFSETYWLNKTESDRLYYCAAELERAQVTPDELRHWFRERHEGIEFAHRLLRDFIVVRRK